MPITGAGPAPPGPVIGIASLIVVAAVIVATLLALRAIAALPILLRDPKQLTLAGQYLSGTATLLTILALGLLWRRLRSVLDLWLMVVMCAYLIQILLVSFPVPARFTLGWYGGQLFGLLAGSLVLIVLLVEIMALYARLLAALLAQRREREARLLTGNAVAAMIAHEIKQPLTGITAHAQAGLRWLDRPAPELDEARDGPSPDRRPRAAHRPGDRQCPHGRSAATPRAVFPSPPTASSPTSSPACAPSSNATASASTPHPNPICPPSSATPASSANASSTSSPTPSTPWRKPPARESSPSTPHFRDGSVRISVADNGPGIRPEDADRIFNPLFTSKPTARAWASPSAAPSSKAMTASSGSPPTRHEAPSSMSRSAPREAEQEEVRFVNKK